MCIQCSPTSVHSMHVLRAEVSILATHQQLHDVGVATAERLVGELCLSAHSTTKPLAPLQRSTC